MANQPLLC